MLKNFSKEYITSGYFQDDYRKNILYINSGNNTFTEKAEEYGLADKSYSTQSYFFDYDSDGDLDLYLLNHPLNPRESNNLKVENDKDQKMKVVMSKDLTFVSDRLDENKGNKFVDVTEKSGILNEAFGLSALVGDFNEDNHLDIYVCNDYVKPDYLYINNGNGTFTDKFADYFDHTSFSSMGSDYADINNDGCIAMMTLDMFPEDNYRQKMHGTEYNYDKYLLTQRCGFASQFIKNTLQINQCDGTYSDVAPMTNMAHTDWSWSVLMADYNNDGKKDVFITNGYRRSTTDNDYVRYTQDSIYKSTPNKAELNLAKFIEAIPIHKTKSYFYMNKGGLQFSNVSQQWDPSPAEFSNGAAYADLDNDGFLDVVVSNIDAPPFVLKNNGATTRKNNFVRFSFKNEKNKPTYGAKIEIIDNLDNLQVFYHYPSKGFVSSVENLAHFGLGKSTSIKSAKVFWPNGKVQSLADVKINSTNKITYDDKSVASKKLVNPSVYFEKKNNLVAPEMIHINIQMISNDSVCRGDTLKLLANSSPGATYQWYKSLTIIPGASSPYFSSITSGYFRCIVTAANGCTKAIGPKITKIVNLPIAIITAAGPTTFCQGQSVVLNANTDIGLTYQWKKFSTDIANATLPSYTPTQAGVYKVITRNAFGCGRTSNTIQVTINCREGIFAAGNNLQLYPNPAQDFTTLEFFATADNATISIYEITGKLVDTFNASTLPNTIASLNIPTAHLPGGVYMIPLVVRSGVVSP